MSTPADGETTRNDDVSVNKIRVDIGHKAHTNEIERTQTND